MSNNYDTVKIELLGMELDAEVHYSHTPEETVDGEFFKETFEFVEFYIINHVDDGGDVDLSNLLGIKEVERNIINQLKEQKAKL